MVSKELQSICIHVWENVRKWVKDNPYIDSENMCGACAIVSYTLFKVLKRRGYDPTFVLAQTKNEDHGHCWVLMDGLIFDLSVKQFKQRGKQVDALVEKEENYFKKVPTVKKFSKILKNIEAIKHINKEWFGQNPIQYQSKINYLVRKLSKV